LQSHSEIAVLGGKVRGLPEAFLDVADLLQALLTTQFALCFREWRWWRRGGRRGWLQADATDVEVFLEAVELEEIGELEGADIAAALADFALEIEDDPAQVLGGEAGT